MFKSTNRSSRSTVYSSKDSNISNKRRKKKLFNKSLEKIPLSETEILAKKKIKDII